MRLSIFLSRQFWQVVFIAGIVVGCTIIWAGIYVDGVEPEAITLGVVIETVASLFFVLLIGEQHGKQLKEFLIWSAAGACFLSIVVVPVAATPFLMLAASPVLLPLLGLELFLFQFVRPYVVLRVPFCVLAFLLSAAVPVRLPSKISKDYPPEPPIQVVSDEIKDKVTAFNDAPEMWHALEVQGLDHVTAKINKSEAVVALDVAALEKKNEGAADEIFSTYAEATRYMQEREMPWVPSVQMIDQKVKIFSDQLYAAVERFAQSRARALGSGKQRFLFRFTEALLKQNENEAAAWLTAALKLGGTDIEKLPDEAKTAGQRHAEEFLKNELLSKPVGVYAEAEDLRLIFLQDRFCEQDLPREMAAAMARALAADKELLEQYQRILQLNKGLTNPAPEGHAALNEALTAGDTAAISIFPPSTSVENILFERVYNSAELPAENIMNRLISMIRAGEVDLTPREDSGWYGWQAYALETLLLPERGSEGNKLLLSKAYKEMLIDAFKVMLTKQRELHVKQMKIVATLGMDSDTRKITIWPDISVEPAATYYLRSARALHMVSQVLETVFGSEDYATIMMADDKQLSAGLTEMKTLLYGLHLVVCRDLGMINALLEGELAPEAALKSLEMAAEWLMHCSNDPEYLEDVRFIVAALTNAERSEVRYWMSAGVKLKKFKAEYARPPRVVFDIAGEEKVQMPPATWMENRILEFGPYEYCMPVEVFIEATGPNVPYTREEFRDICDSSGEPDDIREAIENGGRRFFGCLP